MKAFAGDGEERHALPEAGPDGHPPDAIVKVTAGAMWLLPAHYNGVIPEMEKGDVIGHEPSARSRVGSDNESSGRRPCRPIHHLVWGMLFLQARLYSVCERIDPDAEKAASWGHSPAGFFGYRICSVDIPAARAEYFRGLADVGPRKVPESLSRTEQASAALPTSSDRLHGGRVLQHPGWRDHGHLGVRTGWPVFPRRRLSAWRGPGHRHRWCPSAWRWPKPPGPRPATSERRISTSASRR